MATQVAQKQQCADDVITAKPNFRLKKHLSRAPVKPQKTTKNSQTIRIGTPLGVIYTLTLGLGCPDPPLAAHIYSLNQIALHYPQCPFQS